VRIDGLLGQEAGEKVGEKVNTAARDDPMSNAFFDQRSQQSSQHSG
jgi:hypothetical protein